MVELFIPKEAKSHRSKKIAKRIRECLSSVFLRGDLPAKSYISKEGEQLLCSYPGCLTVTHVDVAPDLKRARIMVVPLLGRHEKETILYLKLARGYIRSIVSKELGLRFVPDLDFEIDSVFETSSKIDALIENIK